MDEQKPSKAVTESRNKFTDAILFDLHDDGIACDVCDLMDQQDDDAILICEVSD